MSESLAARPPMGWNSWNMFGSTVHETAIREIADAIVSSGLKDCGYEYVVIDDCWSQKGGRDRNGDHCELWKKPLSDGSVAVALVNRGSTGSDITVKASDIGMLDQPKLVRNLWAQEDVADFTLELTQRVQPHATILLKIKA